MYRCHTGTRRKYSRRRSRSRPCPSKLYPVYHLRRFKHFALNNSAVSYVYILSLNCWFILYYSSFLRNCMALFLLLFCDLIFTFLIYLRYNVPVVSFRGFNTDDSCSMVISTSHAEQHFALTFYPVVGNLF